MPIQFNRMAGFNLMAKPAGAHCNLACAYCFYLEKCDLLPAGAAPKMDDATLENYTRQYIAAQGDAPEITFAWQGGEPTLAGLDFFHRARELQRKYAGGRRVNNSLQTNGTLLDDNWCRFLAREGFLVGISVDGPPRLHNAYRTDRRGQPSAEAVLRGVELLRKHRAPFNTLTVVNRKNSREPLEVYRFLKKIGAEFMQFIPIVERQPTAEERAAGLSLGGPPDLGAVREYGPMTEWSVTPEDYGDFLRAIFDEWVKYDVGRYFVQQFDSALGNYLGVGGGVCVYAERCGDAMILEHNGDVYACDHFAYPSHYLGNLNRQPLTELVNLPRQIRFGLDKSDRLPKFCLNCRWRPLCHGACPKHRFCRAPDGEPGLNYLCAGYRRFFAHIEPKLAEMAALVRAGREAREIMSRPSAPAGRGRKKGR